MALLTFKEIMELIDKVADREISAVEIESGGVKVRVEGKKNDVAISFSNPTQGGQPMGMMPAIPAMIAPPFIPVPLQGVPENAPAAAEKDEIDASWHLVTSPIVGTFYRSPNPEAEPFANVGDSVSKGDVLCIIEAMKLMNEIESDADGVVTRVFPQNGQPIEYGEKLFAIKTG
ncbi:MAG TPA: acetyl-CoA carboxylase biotin carboxyl carrier protein [Thermoanaerobaculia bacterium]